MLIKAFYLQYDGIFESHDESVFMCVGWRKTELEGKICVANRVLRPVPSLIFKLFKFTS